MNSFEGYLQPYSERIKDLEKSNTEFKGEKEKSSSKNQQLSLEISDLKSQLEEWKEFANLIPEELLMELTYQQMRSIEKEEIQSNYDMELE